MPRSIFYRLLLLWLLLPALATAETLTVLYKRESAQSLSRTETAVQSVLIGLERELIDRGLEVIQPDAKTYAVLDQAPGTVVTFSPDAGFALLVDAVKSTRANPGADNSFAEVRLRARLFHGRRVLASLAGSGQIGFRPGSEDKAFESAADRAARQLIAQLVSKLEDAPPPAAAEPAETPVADANPAPLPATGKKWALLIGISDFSNVRKLNPKFGVPDLNATPDVVLIGKTLLEIGTPGKQIQVLIDKDATTAAIRSALRDLQAKTRPEDQVLFYIASHGLPKQEGISGFGYPVTYDTRFSDKNSIIDFEEIQTALKSLPAQQVLWLADTCHSGGATLGMPVVEISQRAVRLQSASGLSTRAALSGVGPKNMAILSSAKEDQVALEDGENGLFTLKLVQGIRKTSRGESIYRVFKDHVEAQVPARSQELADGYRQQPVFAKSGRGDGLSF